MTDGGLGVAFFAPVDTRYFVEIDNGLHRADGVFHAVWSPCLSDEIVDLILAGLFVLAVTGYLKDWAVNGKVFLVPTQR
jgi:hypothetical protein